MSSDEIKEAVKNKYSCVAKEPSASFNFPVGRAFALKVGYPEEILATLPEAMYESFTGANNPQAFVDLKEGEVVLDLGCGAGLDIYFYAKAVKGNGKVYGLDISEDMVSKAKSNMEAVGIKMWKLNAAIQTIFLLVITSLMSWLPMGFITLSR